MTFVALKKIFKTFLHSILNCPPPHSNIHAIRNIYLLLEWINLFRLRQYFWFDFRNYVLCKKFIRESLSDKSTAVGLLLIKTPF